MNNWFERTELLIGKQNITKLANKHVLVVGLGGVGAYTAEQICRAGIGEITIVDGDVIDVTNINRQLPAVHSKIGMEKTKIVAEKLLDINPNLKLNVVNEYLKDDKIISLLSKKYDYVVDAIDTLAPKVFLIYYSIKNNLPIVSSMGAGGKFDPLKVKVVDIKKSYGCKLARVVRKRLHRLGIRKGVKVVFSPEEIVEGSVIIDESENKKSTVGTISYMPPLFGCIVSSVVIRDLLEL